MYSLLNASTLGFDLARLPGGADVADVLLDALALRADDLVRVALPEPAGAEPDAATPWRVQDALALMCGGDLASLVLMGSTLRTATIGDVDQLLTCLRREWFDWGDVDDADLRLTAELVESCCSAVVRSAWCGCGPVRWRPLAARPVDLGPQADRVAGLLAEVAMLTGDQAERLQDAWCARGAQGSPVRWSQAMHGATWAVELTGRARAAMAAQLHLVGALHRAGVDVTLVAGGAWNALSGVVQALVVEDLLDGSSSDELVAPARDILRRFG
jgi:hypothetical protein